MAYDAQLPSRPRTTTKSIAKRPSVPISRNRSPTASAWVPMVPA